MYEQKSHSITFSRWGSLRQAPQESAGQDQSTTSKVGQSLTTLDLGTAKLLPQTSPGSTVHWAAYSSYHFCGHCIADIQLPTIKKEVLNEIECSDLLLHAAAHVF